MASPISVYLSDADLKKLDAIVKAQASLDRNAGLEGRQIMNRSKLVSQLIEERFRARPPLTFDRIEYAVTELAKSYGAESVSLFGSYARGEQTEDSDVDVLLKKGDIKGLRVLDFQEDLSNELGCKVDVVTTAGASDRFLRKVSEDAILLYQREVA